MTAAVPPVATRAHHALLAQGAARAAFAAALILSIHAPGLPLQRVLQMLALVALLAGLGLRPLLRRGLDTLRAPLAGSALVFGVLVAGAALVVDPAVHEAFDTPKLFLLVGAAALLLLGWAIALVRRPEPVVITWIEVLLLGALAWGFASNPRWLHSLDAAWVRATVALGLVTFLVRQWFGAANGDGVRRRVAAGDLLNALWVSGVVLAVLGFRQAYDAGTFQYESGMAKTPMVSTLGTPNAYGSFLAAGIIGALATAAQARSRYARTLLGAAALVQLAALSGNGSRGALLGLLTAALLTGWSRLALRRRERGRGARSWHPGWRTLAAAMVALLVLGSAVTWLHRVNPASGRGRLMAWEVSLRMAADRPLRGVGAGRYGLEYPAWQAALWRDPEHARFAYQAARRRQPHSEPVHLFAERGIPGVLLFVALWGSAVFFMLRSFGTARRPAAADWGVFALLVAIPAHALVDTALHWIPTALAAHAALGLVPAPALLAFPARRRTALVLLLLSAPLAAHAVLRTVREYPGYRLWREGQQAHGASAVTALRAARARLEYEPTLDHDLGAALLRVGRPDAAASHLERALTLVDDLDFRLALGRAYLELGRIAEAERQALAALASFPDRLRPQLLLARVHIAAGRHPEARAALTRCILRRTHYGSESVDAVVAEARALWLANYDDRPPG